jgi:hypothetical protein
MPTLAENYFDKFTAPGAADLITSLPTGTEKTFEDDWLDFKGGQLANAYLQAAPKDKQKAKADLEKLWSEIVGQFANNEGGCVVWGVDAAKTPNAQGNEVDAPKSLSPIQDTEAFKSLLAELGRFVTDPPVSGIRHEVVKPDATKAEGFLVSFIPQGKQKPYRSEKAGKRFLIRSGDSKVDMSVSLLRTLFFPQQRPDVTISVTNGNPQWLEDYARDTELGMAYVYSLDIFNNGERSIREGDFDFHIPACFISKIVHEGLDPDLIPSLGTWATTISLPTLHPQTAASFDILVTPRKGYRSVFFARIFAADTPALSASGDLPKDTSESFPFVIREMAEE